MMSAFRPFQPRRRVPFLLLPVLALSLGADVRAVSSIELRSGASVTGDILVEKADRLVVDLGFTVLEVPRDEIVRVQAETVSTDSDTAVDALDLYRVAPGQPILPVNQNVDRVGEAVVQIRTQCIGERRV